MFEWRQILNQLLFSPCGEIGRHKRLKISRSKDRAGSSPAGGTKKWHVAQLVELRAVNSPVVGSSPTMPAKNAGLAQQVEQRTCNAKVASSILASGTI